MINFVSKTILLLAIFLMLPIQHVFAVSDPRATSNNKVGINIMSPEAEIEDAATLVNTDGDWGYVVIILTRNERNVERLQAILDRTLDQHLIPIIRLATEFDAGNGYWKRPEERDAKEWADFLSKLHYPTRNRYIQVYNEVNRAAEWGGKVDPADYAKELSKTTAALKAKSGDFFILNAPLDLALASSVNSLDASLYFEAMNDSIPGIFAKLDGLASHSYPNPAFSASPSERGRIKINGFSWELDQISRYSDKDLPVFITETGWVRGASGLSEEVISQYYEDAFRNAWNDNRVVVVAPFLLSYPEPLFNEFSFKSDGSDPNKPYYKYFSAIRDMPKVKGEPERRNILSNFKIDKQDYISQNSGDSINFEFKNMGNYLWEPGKDLEIKILGQNIIVNKTLWSKKDVYPGNEIGALINIRSVIGGVIPLEIQVVSNNEILVRKEITIHINSPFSGSVLSVKSSSAAFR
ncbi:MAG: hypothetical protein WD967_00825 [Candidatus Levyibacteriota bacterium]